MVLSANFITRRVISFILRASILLWCVIVFFGFPYKAAASDIKGHWAEAEINSWLKQGFVKGYQDGNFKPNHPITRAEFTTLANKVFSLTEIKEITFSDVTTANWFFKDVGKAVEAGYMAGYPNGTFGPNKNINRQELAVIVSKLLALPGSDSVNLLKDAASLPQWSKNAIGAVLDKHIMFPFKDQTFRPTVTITRADAVVALDKAMKAKFTFYNEAGTFGPENKDIVINVAGVTLQNMRINGNLVLAEGIGQGEVFLKNVIVTGTTTILGGGFNSIHIEDSTLGTVNVNKADGNIRVVVEGSTVLQQVNLKSGAILEESNITGAGFGSVNLLKAMPANSIVTLDGLFDTADLQAKGITINLPKGSVNQINVSAESVGTKINIDQASNVGTLTLNAASKVTGLGSIGTAYVNVVGISIEQTPGSIELASGITANIGPDDNDKPTAEITYTVDGNPVTSVKDGTSVLITANFSETIVDLPLVQLERKLTDAKKPMDMVRVGPTTYSYTWLVGDGASKGNGIMSVLLSKGIDISGNVVTAKPTEGSGITVDNIAPTNQDTVLTTSQSVKGGANITIASSGEISNKVWLAPAGTLTAPSNNGSNNGYNNNYSTNTSQALDGTALTIAAPQYDGVYYLYVSDAAGNISAQSTRTVTVINTAPSSQNAVLITAQTVKGGTSVSIVSSGLESNKIWLAPPGIYTVPQANGSTVTQAANGTASSILAPTVAGTYYIYVSDAAGNLSSASYLAITVDNTPPTNQDAVLTAAQTVLGGGVVNIISSGVDNNQIWLAPVGILTVPTPNGTTITKAFNGTAYTITAPTTPGTYRLYISDAAGNLSAPSVLSVIVDNTLVLANQNAVLLEAQYIRGGVPVNIVSSGVESNKIWLAPVGLTSVPSANGTTITMAANGTASTIVAPTAEGTYHVYVSNTAGNLSPASVLTVIVDNTAPNGAVTVSAGLAIAVNKTTNTITLTQAGVFEGGNTLRITPALISIDSADDNETTPNVALDESSLHSVTSTADTLVITLKANGVAFVDAIMAAFTGNHLDSVDFSPGWLKDLA